MEKLTSSEKLLREVDLSYEEKMKRTAEIEHSRATFLKEVGLVNQLGTRLPIIINLHEDEQMSERLVYCIQLGLTVIGSSSGEANIVLPGKTQLIFNISPWIVRRLQFRVSKLKRPKAFAIKNFIQKSIHLPEIFYMECFICYQMAQKLKFYCKFHFSPKRMPKLPSQR